MGHFNTCIPRHLEHGIKSFIVTVSLNVVIRDKMYFQQCKISIQSVHLVLHLKMDDVRVSLCDLCLGT